MPDAVISDHDVPRPPVPFLGALARHRLLVLVATSCALIVVALVMAVLPQRYSATTSVLVQPAALATPDAEGGGDTEAVASMDTEAEVVRSSPVAEQARTSLAPSMAAQDLISATTVTVADDTTILLVTFRADSPEAARTGADAVAAEYLRYRSGQVRDEVASRVEVLSGRAGEVQGRIRQVSARLALAPPRSDQRADLERQLARLAAESDRLDAQTIPLLTTPTAVGSVIGPADLPTQPDGPPPAVVLAWLLALAIASVVLVATWRDHRQGVVHRTREIEKAWGVEVVAALTTTALEPESVQSHRRLLQTLRTRYDGTAVLVVGAGDDAAGIRVAEELAGSLATLARRAGVAATVVQPARSGPTTRAAAAEGDGPRVVDLELLTVDDEVQQPLIGALLHRLALDGGDERLTLVAAPQAGPTAQAWSIAPHVDLVVIVVELHGSRHEDVAEVVTMLDNVGAIATCAVTVAPPPAPSSVRAGSPPAPPGRSLRLVLAAALLVAAGLGTWLVTRDTGDGPTATRRPDTPAVKGATARATGAGLSRPGISVSATVDERGDVEVVERVITERAVDRLRVSMPADSGDPAQEPARLLDLTVSAGDEAVPVADVGSLTDSEQALDLVLPEAGSRFVLRYRLVGAAVRSAQAPPGRVTLTLGSAVRTLDPDLDVRTDIGGAPIRTLLCPQATPEEQLCGLEDPEGWHTTPLTAEASLVVALADLPPA